MNHFNFADLAQALFEEAGDALFLFDPDSDQLLEVNATALRLSGFSRPELLRIPVTSLYRFEAAGGRARMRHASQETGIFHSQDGFLLRTRQDDLWIPVNLTITRLHVKPKTLALITARDVREQRDAHRRLKSMEAELRRVMSSVSDCLWSAEIDADGHWTYSYISPVIEKITGRPPDFFLGGLRHWWGVVYPKDRPRCENALVRLRSGQPSQEEYRVVWPDGRHRWVHDSVLPSRSGPDASLRLDGVLTDITDSKFAEEALARERALLRGLIDSIPDLIFYKDRQGRYLGCNAAYEAYAGRREAEVVGRTDADLFSPEAAQAGQETDRQVLAEARPRRLEQWVRYPDGKRVLVELLKTPFFNHDGRLLGLIAVCRDITERKQSEEALRHTVASEREAHQGLKDAQSRLVQSEKLAGLGRLVAGVAHEINNPLAFVNNNFAVLQRDVAALRDLLRLYGEGEAALGERRPDLLARIRAFAEEIDLPYTLENLDGLVVRSRDGVQRIQAIVKGLRDFARLDESDLKEVDINEGVRSTLDIVRGEAKKKGVRLTVDLAPLPEVTCYPAKVNQVVMNLVANAIQASPEGGEVTVRTSASAGGVAIHVRDSGRGIDPAIREKIFDPFFTTKPPGQGTGLGLSISYRIVQDHGGRIEVESLPGEGAHFTVHLPLKARPAAPRRA